MKQVSRVVMGWLLAAGIGLAAAVVVNAQERPEDTPAPPAQESTAAPQAPTPPSAPVAPTSPAPPAPATRTPQPPPAPRAAEPPPGEPVPPTADPFIIEPRFRSQSLRIGQDFTLRTGDTIREVVVIAGTATIEGHVEGDVVVILGSANLASTALVDGDLVVVGGGATVATGAAVNRDVVIVGGMLDAPADFMPGGEHVVIGPSAIGGRFEAIVPWITRGLLWGRPIVPNLGWVWAVVGVIFLVYLVISLIFDQPVRACADKLAERPLSALMAGLLTLLLAGPVCFLLAVSIIGLAVVPFVLCAMFIAGLVGRIGVARWIGMRILRFEDDGRVESIATFALGFAVITFAYLVPVLGFIVWLMVGVFGLGAATLAVGAAYRRENPRRVSAVRTPPPPPPSTFIQHGEQTSADPLPGATATADAHAPAVGTVPPATAMAASDLTSFPRAMFLERVGAFALDIALALFVSLFVSAPFDDGPGMFFFLLLVYRIAFWAWKGTTVGGIICQLRVVRVDGAPLGFPDALVRGLASIFSFVALGLGCLWVLRDQERQAWHDKIAGTYVVKVPRNWPL